MSQRIMTMVLAGGEGKRLHPLTRSRAKPAVPFGGHYRLIDFVLSNLTNAHFHHIAVLTQYKSHSLDKHLSQAWRLSPILGNYVTAVPAQMRRGPHWYSGSADAIFQNLNILDDERPDHVIVFGADHIYRMDPRQMLDAHIASGAGVTVAGIRVPVKDATDFGVIDADSTGRIKAFVEKPAVPPTIPDDPSLAFASMGSYIFRRDVLEEVIRADAEEEESKHDLGGNIIPSLVAAGVAHVYDYASNLVPGQSHREVGYWRDVGTIDSYYEASMDLIALDPIFDLYNEAWPIRTWQPTHPPAKFIHNEGERRGRAINSMVSSGAVVSGGHVVQSILSPLVRINSFSEIEGSILFENVRVGRGAVVRNAIIDKNVWVPAGMKIGVDLEADRERFTVSDSGIIVIGKNDKLEELH
ncbi:MAG: glucose-1-phosphate adenylyltransferase [Acidimicrobiia bacterium]|nr:glucose-1-phosphate adenylyltransferase [Acidimicrobiia bacterium]